MGVWGVSIDGSFTGGCRQCGRAHTVGAHGDPMVPKGLPQGPQGGSRHQGAKSLATNKETPQTPKPRHASVGTKESNSGHMQGDLNII